MKNCNLQISILRLIQSKPSAKQFIPPGAVSIVFLLFLILHCPAPEANAQDFVKTYHSSAKHHHMIPLSDQDGNGYVVAGTYGDFEGGIAFLHTDNAGNVLHYKVYREPDHVKTCFDFTNHDGSYFITALRRATDKDRIELIEVDAAGNILSDILITPDPASADCFYPIHTMSHDGYLYICGYIAEGTAYPTLIDYTTNKRAFVLKYDPATQAVIACYRYDSYNDTYSAPPTGADYDMAVRMVPLSNGDIYVTGSCNIVRPRYDPNNIPIGQTNDHEYTSGTLNMTVTANLGVQLQNVPLGHPWGFNENRGEHGQSLIEVGGNYYNAGNYVSLPLVQAGLYFVTIRADGKTLASAKLIIQ